MMKPLSALALVIGAACAANPALAQTTITQLGNASTVAVDQTAMEGANNIVTIMQLQDTAGSSIKVSQANVVNSSAILAQTGANDQMSVNQHDGMHLLANVNYRGGEGQPAFGGGGGNNSVMIDQSGQDALANVHQVGGFNNVANIQQQSGGWLNADIWQTGNGNVANISQSGFNHNAAIVQWGGQGNTATITQRN